MLFISIWSASRRAAAPRWASRRSSGRSIRINPSGMCAEPTHYLYFAGL